MNKKLRTRKYNKTKIKNKTKKTKINSKRNKNGGDAIGAGGFGCVFSPALSCKGKPVPSKDMVSKLMLINDANMEAKISEMVSEGKTKQEVMDYYVEMYGEQILAVPIASGFNLMAWLAPVAVFLIGVLIFFNYLKQKSLEPVTKPGSEKDKKIQYDDLIERELKERE